jgi:hypothetical protein
MSREETIEFVRQLEEAVNNHDTARLLSFYADNAVTVSPVFGGIAGKAAIVKSWDDIFSLLIGLSQSRTCFWTATASPSSGLPEERIRTVGSGNPRLESESSIEP